MLLALAAGCPDDGDGGAGNGGDNMCADTGVMNGLTQACASCGCDKCPTQVADCQDAACQSVLSCGISTGCTGTDCYCGIGKPVADCLTLASGPCMAQIVAASGVMVGTPGCMTMDTCAVALSPLRTTMGNALYRADQVSRCTKGAAAVMDTMGMITMPAVAGMCTVECM